jgi:DNA-binding transcriptional ArsR family regulator
VSLRGTHAQPNFFRDRPAAAAAPAPADLTAGQPIPVSAVKPGDVSAEWDPEDVFDVLASESARRILVLASAEAMTAEDLAERIDASLPTVYRRANALVEYDLLTENTEIDTDGNHYRTFETNLERITVEIEGGDLEAEVELDRDLVDRFGDLWRDLEGSGGEG